MAKPQAMPTDYGTWGLLFSAWLIALAASLGVLFIGEIMGQSPCNLCWYQRVFMFPLAVILALAAYRTDSSVWRHSLPLAILGCGFAAYHTLLYADVIPQEIQPCGDGPSCSGAGMTILGGIPLPALSLAAFAAIAVLLILIRRDSKK